MGLTELFIIAVGLSMDAFAVSVCKGLSVQKMNLGHALICGVYFGGFQALMPLLGYLLGRQFASKQGEDVAVFPLHAYPLFVLIGCDRIEAHRNAQR